MSFFYPHSFWLLLSLIPLILLFLYKVRIPEKTIDSILLIKRLIGEKRLNLTRENGVKSLKILLLQVAFVCLAVMAVTAPVIIRNEQSADIVLLIDTSASMKTNYKNKPRSHHAKLKADKIISTLSPGRKMLIASFDSRVYLRTRPTDNQALLSESVSSLQTSGEPGGLTVDHIELIRSAVFPNLHNPKIIVLTDHIPLQITPAEDCGFYLFSESDGNAGITDITLQNKKNSDLTISITITNDSDRTFYAPVGLYQDERLINRTSTVIDPNSEAPLIFSINPDLWETQTATFKLEIDDAFNEDNTLHVTIPKPVKILLMGYSPHLDQAIRTYESVEIVETTELSPCLVVNINQPGAGTEEANLIVNPMRGKGVITVGERISLNSPINILMPDHPILRNISFHGITIPYAHEIELPAGVSILASANSIPIIFCSEKDNSRQVVLNFPLEDTDLPRRISFPVLIANIIDWITNTTAHQPTLADIIDRKKTVPIEKTSLYAQTDITPNFFLQHWLLLSAVGILLTEGIIFYGLTTGERQ